MKYKTVVKDSFFKLTLDGEFEAKSLEDAEKQCRDFYAQELDTTPDAVELVSISPFNMTIKVGEGGVNL